MIERERIGLVFKLATVALPIYSIPTPTIITLPCRNTVSA
jgi:hypothetical protein